MCPYAPYRQYKLTLRNSFCSRHDTKQSFYEFAKTQQTMPKKRFLGNRSFKIMGGAPQCFNAPDGAQGARPMSLRGGNQSQWLGSSRVGTLMRQDVYIENDMRQATRGQLAPVRPSGQSSNKASPNKQQRNQVQSSWGVQTYLDNKSGPKTDIFGTNPDLPESVRKTRQRIPELPPPKQPLVATGLKRQVQANVGTNALDSMYYTDPSPLPLPRKTQFNRSELVRNRIQYGSTAPLAKGPTREVGFGEKEDRLMQVEFTRDGYTGKVCDWAISGDAPKWMTAQHKDKKAILTKIEQKKQGFETAFYKEGKGKVTDWSVSADGPGWMTDVLEKYDPEAILEPTVLHRGKAQFFSVSKNFDTGGNKDHSIRSKVALHTDAAGLSTMGAQHITDSSTSNDMPSYFRDQSRRILGPNDVLEPPENSNKNWYNRTKVKKPKNFNQHASYQSTRETTIGNTGTGMKGKIELYNGNLINDSTMSGDAPDFMVDLSRRTDPSCVFVRPNNQLQFQNKTYSTEKNQLWKYDDSSVSGDAPDWMTDTNMRIDSRNVVEPEKRSFANSKSSPSYRKAKKHEHKIKMPRQRTKKTKWTTDVPRHTLMTTRKSVKM